MFVASPMYQIAYVGQNKMKGELSSPGGRLPYSLKFCIEENNSPKL